MSSDNQYLCPADRALQSEVCLDCSQPTARKLRPAFIISESPPSLSCYANQPYGQGGVLVTIHECSAQGSPLAAT